MQTARTLRPDELDNELRAKFIWGGVVFGLLGLQILMCLVAAFLATKDPSFAIVPDYHQRSLAWDADRAAQSASNQLGWTAKVEFDVQPDILGKRRLTIGLTDRDGKPIESARVSAKVFHHARANDVQSMTFQEMKPGVYTTNATMRRAGIWEFRINAEKADARFRQTIVKESDGQGRSN